MGIFSLVSPNAAGLLAYDTQLTGREAGNAGFTLEMHAGCMHL